MVAAADIEAAKRSVGSTEPLKRTDLAGSGAVAACSIYRRWSLMPPWVVPAADDRSDGHPAMPTTGFSSDFCRPNALRRMTARHPTQLSRSRHGLRRAGLGASAVAVATAPSDTRLSRGETRAAIAAGQAEAQAIVGRWLLTHIVHADRFVRLELGTCTLH